MQTAPPPSDFHPGGVNDEANRCRASFIADVNYTKFRDPLAQWVRFMVYYASLFGATGLWRNWLAHWTVDPGVAGSSPVDPANPEKSRVPRGVMVAPQILILLVGVRVPARQPFAQENIGGYGVDTR